MAYDPLIILGMHRSGTSMITGVLEELGLFVGAQKDPNNESLFFLNLNNWLFQQANVFWDNPKNFQFLDAAFKHRVLPLLENYLTDFLKRVKFLGWPRTLRYKSIKHLDFPWGWKDPRNTFTIDIWKEIFPKARVIHIYRNPIDVAQSLRLRELEERRRVKDSAHNPFKNNLRKYYFQYNTRSQRSPKVTSIMAGIQLWEDYVQKAFSLEELFKNNILNVKYEDLLDTPEHHLKHILDFIKLKASPQRLQAAIMKIKPERRLAFLRNEKLVGVYEKVKGLELVKKLDYHELTQTQEPLLCPR
jgi:hypothetical protein